MRWRGSGERPLASATTTAGVLVAGTREALVVGEVRIPWQDIESADWDQESSTLRVAEVGVWGEQRPIHELAFDEPGRLLELIRERITASIVLQRHIPVIGRRGLFVIGRRSPVGDATVRWIYEYQEGVDPDDPDVRRAAAAGLAAARDEVGL
ncbi:conserved hypothetical protein [metagenome]|uniref:Uncharacterized protein n=1 Tax=metagenome TaxID=256318 RepID=A0A2P2BX06_9ZZZZ